MTSMSTRKQLIGAYAEAYAGVRNHVRNAQVPEAIQHIKQALVILRDLIGMTPSEEERSRILEHAKRLGAMSDHLRAHGTDHHAFLMLNIVPPTVSQSPHTESQNWSDTADADPESQGWSADLFQRYCGSVAEITAQNDREISSGTGFVISENGYLLTNHHVIWNERCHTVYADLRMKLPFEKYSGRLEVIDVSKADDLALCRFTIPLGVQFRAIPLVSDYTTVQQGADVLIIGNAFSMGLAPVNGIVRYTHDHKGNLVYSALSNHGDSGAPVFTRLGECIGINKSSTVSISVNNTENRAVGMANATPMDKIREHLDRWCRIHHINL